MIDQETITSDWIGKVSKANCNADKMSFFRAACQEPTQIRRKRPNPELSGTKKTDLESSCSYFGKIDYNLHTW